MTTSNTTINNAIDGLFGLLKTVATVTANEPLPAEDLGIMYITKRIIIMNFPSSKSTHIGKPIDNISHYFQAKLSGRFMIINLSENSYDYSRFEDQVLEFKFPGYPAPPLDTLFAMCNSIDHWLKADSKNVVAVHCQSGRGRSICTVAAYMLWCGQLDTPQNSIEYIGIKMKREISSLLIPTQIRYLDYVSLMKQGRRPSSRVLTLQRVIMNGIPMFEDDQGCTPYLQVFHKAKLLYTSTGRGENSSKLKSYTVDDISVLFPVDIDIEGDILIRIRHISRKTTKRTSMLRFGFHTGYFRPGMHRFQKHEIDGAVNNERFPDDFHVDLIVDGAEDQLGNTRKSDRDRSFWEKVSTRVESPDTTRNNNDNNTEESSEFRLFGDDDDDDEKAALNALSVSDNVKIQTNDDKGEKKFDDLEAYVTGLNESNAIANVDVDSDTEQIFEQLSKELDTTTTTTTNTTTTTTIITTEPKQMDDDDEDELLASLLAADDNDMADEYDLDSDDDIADLEAMLK